VTPLFEPMAASPDSCLIKRAVTLATAILTYDWRETQARTKEAWIYHILRREAERLIVPNLTGFLEADYQPQENAERLAFLGACQFLNRTVDCARVGHIDVTSTEETWRGVPDNLGSFTRARHNRSVTAQKTLRTEGSAGRGLRRGTRAIQS
jgi:hypothetical protein